MNAQDAMNLETWSAAGTINWLATIKGFTDAAEEAAYHRIADEMHDEPILDLGVGAGRTIPLLLKLSRNYTAVDYSPAMVDVARRKYPNVDIQLIVQLKMVGCKGVKQPLIEACSQP